MSEKEIRDALDRQEAYIADRQGRLHRAKTVEGGPDDDDFIFCTTCGRDLRSVAVCGDAPVGRCGCPLFAVLDNDHWDVCSGNEVRNE